MFPYFPLVLNTDGSPWAPAYLWLLDCARARPHEVSSFNPVIQGLRAYKQFLDEFGFQWDDFSAVGKYLRPTYRYKTHFRGLINSGAAKHSTASSHMQTVVGFYQFLMESERLGFRPQNAPWVNQIVGLEYRDSRGFKQVKEVTTTDISIGVPKRNYMWDRRVDNNGKLLPLSRREQKTLVKALKLLGNRDYGLMYYIALLAGARIRTVLTLRWDDFATSPSQTSQWPFELQCEPGTGIDTKGDVPDVHLSVQEDLCEWLRIYAVSDRAGSRRGKSNLEQDPMNYLFLPSQGGPHYEPKADHNALWDSAEPPLRRSSPAGQSFQSFITGYVVPEIRKIIPALRYQFHDLRTTLGVNWVDAVIRNQGTRQRYIWARDQLRKLI